VCVCVCAFGRRDGKGRRWVCSNKVSKSATSPQPRNERWVGGWLHHRLHHHAFTGRRARGGDAPQLHQRDTRFVEKLGAQHVLPTHTQHKHTTQCNNIVQSKSRAAPSGKESDSRCDSCASHTTSKNQSPGVMDGRGRGCESRACCTTRVRQHHTPTCSSRGGSRQDRRRHSRRSGAVT
jgi:hypothetical protein